MWRTFDYWRGVCALILGILIHPGFLLASAPDESSCLLRVYSYDSLLAPQGLGSFLFDQFEKKYPDCKIVSESFGDGMRIKHQIESDAKKRKTRAQILLGVDPLLFASIHSYVDTTSLSIDLGSVPSWLHIAPGFVSFDYSPMAWIWDEEYFGRKIKGPIRVAPPKNLQELIQPWLKKKLLVQDPRTSLPGFSFLAFSFHLLGDQTWSYWKNLSQNWLTLSPGWDMAYRLFLEGEAPLVWSYLTSEAYHREEDPSRELPRYRALFFEEGNPVQVEGAIIVKDSLRSEQQKRAAQFFMELLISLEVQTEIPLKNWMFPVHSKVFLPRSFQMLSKPKKIIPLWGASNNSKVFQAERTEILLQKWNKAILGQEEQIDKKTVSLQEGSDQG